MLLNQIFGKTLRDAPKDESSANAQLLIRAGFAKKLFAGVYELLPLGLRVVRKIENVVREEMNAIGGQEVLLTTLQPKELWDESGRWEKLKGAMYQLKDSSGKEFGLGFTHEEPMVDLVRERIASYKDLPIYLYQIQSKYRDEPRPRSGLLRGREFLMKDLYSFSKNKEDLDRFYEICAGAYRKIFARVGLKTVYTEAAGGVFTKENTHEFQVVSPAGEDTIFVCDKCDFAQNKEIASVKNGDRCPNCTGQVKEERAIEVGNIFRFGTAYAENMGMYFLDEKGKKQPVYLGSYGIGITRTLATVVEIFHDDRGLVWPASIAPAQIHLISLGVDKEARELYENLITAGKEIIFDDRDVSAGVKLADADLIGFPQRWVLSEKTLKEGSIEVKMRNEEKVSLRKIGDLV